LAAIAHGAQTRRSGEPYIHHPVAVAFIIAEQQLDIFSIKAAGLHYVFLDQQDALIHAYYIILDIKSTPSLYLLLD
jgi:(p)ppGpp synthase/HD superfamily hydrolase